MRDELIRPRHVCYGSSSALDAATAVSECIEKFDLRDVCCVLVLVSSQYDRAALSSALSRQMNGIAAFGCTTAGQINGQGYESDGMMIIAFPKAHFRCASILIDDLASTSVEDIANRTERHAERFRRTAGWQRLGLLLSDGASHQVDVLSFTLDTVLGDLPLFGGSAGDGLDFGPTYVLHDGAFHTNAAVLLLLETDLRFVGLNFDHFLPTDTRMVVTRADPERRLIHEINGAPAAVEYARVLGREVEDLTPEVFAENPLLILYRQNHYVRGIYGVVDGRALQIMAAIDDGLILTLGQGQDQIATMRTALDVTGPDGETPDFILGFDCIFRKLEFEQKQLLGSASALLSERQVLGFSTYGEQHAGVHMNQTFVGVAFFDPSQEEMF